MCKVQRSPNLKSKIALKEVKSVALTIYSQDRYAYSPHVPYNVLRS